MAELQQQIQAILSDSRAMEQIGAIARSLSGGGAGEAPFAPVEPPASPPPGPDPGAIDPRLLAIGGRLMEAWSAPDDDRTALLEALRPFLREERREMLDKAGHAARLSRVLRAAMGLWKEEGGV